MCSILITVTLARLRVSVKILYSVNGKGWGYKDVEKNYTASKLVL